MLNIVTEEVPAAVALELARRIELLAAGGYHAAPGRVAEQIAAAFPLAARRAAIAEPLAALLVVVRMMGVSLRRGIPDWTHAQQRGDDSADHQPNATAGPTFEP